MNIQQFWSDVLAQRADEIREYFHADAYVACLIRFILALVRLPLSAVKSSHR